jgi:hypothetical protein
VRVSARMIGSQQLLAFGFRREYAEAGVNPWVPAAAWPLSQHGVWIANRGSGFCPESVLY